MTTLPPPSQVAGRHLPLFEAYYKELDPKNTNTIGALAAAKFLKNSGLSDVLLSKIWDLSDPNATGSLTKPGLFVALKLVSLAQNSVDVSMVNIGQDVPPPMMGDATVFPPNIPVAPSPLTTATQAPVPSVGVGPKATVDWSMTPMEKLKYETLFESLQPQNGFIPGNKVKGVLMDSKLPTDTLGKIWDLADMDKDGCLDRHEFIVAMHLVYKALEKFSIPASLPPELLPPAKRKALEMNRMTPPTVAPAPIPWVISKEDQARFEAMFIKADADQDGYVNGPEIKHVFLSCNLPQHVLANVWSLADMHQVGRLNKEQFCLALWLVQHALKGHELPTSLSPEMVPPSMRGGPGPPAPPAPAQPPPPPSNPEMDMISKDIAELAGERSSLESEVTDKTAEISIRGGELKSLQGELDALAATLRQLENQKIEAAKRLGDLKVQTRDIHSELTEVESEMELEQSQVDKLRAQATEQETLLSRQEHEVHSKKQELDALKQEEHELEKKQKEVTKKVTHLDTGFQDSQLLITQIQNKVMVLEELQANMHALILLSEQVEAKTAELDSVPESLLTLEPEYKQPEYSRLVQDSSKTNGDVSGAFASSNGFSSDPFVSTNSKTEGDPFASAFASNSSDPFADSAGDSAPSDSRFTKDPFGCDPFAAGGATLHTPGSSHPPPRPESPSPALPPKKSKQPPPRPAPPRPSAPTQATTAPPPSASDGFADFDNFNTKAVSTVLSSPFSTSSVYSSTSSLSHSSLKSPPPTSAITRRTSFDSSFAIGRPISRGNSASSVSSRTAALGAVSGSTNSLSKNYPPLNDFTDDPFKDYRYEDPFNIVDPFSDDDQRSTSTLPARTKPDGEPSHFDPFVESGSTLSGSGSKDLFSNDPFFSASQSGSSSTKQSTATFGDSFTDPFFSQNSSNGVRTPKSDDPFKSASSNGFGDPFSFSTNKSTDSRLGGDSQFGDDNFANSLTAFDTKSSNAISKTSTSSKPLTKLNGLGQGGGPSEDEQLAWAAVESLKLDNEQKLKDKQEREDLEFALKLSQQGDTSFPVKW